VQRFAADDLKNAYSAYHQPYGRVRNGETFQIETADCFGGRFRDPATVGPADFDWVEKNLDVVTGPIHVEGARPGDIVAITIEQIQITTPGTFVVREWSQASPDDWWLDHKTSRALTIEDDCVVVGAGLRVPIRPIIGCLATAPADETILSRYQGEYGGNQDCVDMTTGATVLLPVNIDGGLIYFGDCKARMADGEIVDAPEIGTLITATVSVRPRPAAMRWPRVETASSLVTVVSDISLADASRQAFRELMLWIEADYQIERPDLVAVMGMLADTAICQVSNRLHTARCSISRDALAELGPRRT
jgi:amidase